jgi:uncharacterized membrane protein YhdT
MTYNIPSNLTSPDSLIIDIANQIPYFTPAILTLIYITILTTGYFSQKREGIPNAPIWFAIAGFITSVIAIVLYIIQDSQGFNLIDQVSLSITIVVFVISVMYAFFANKE